MNDIDDYNETSYEHYKTCGQCSATVLPYIIITDESGVEQCPYCGGHDLGPAKRNIFYSLENYLESLNEKPHP